MIDRDMQEQELQPMHHDVWLDTLVKGANDHGLEMGLTLSVKGITVSGTLVGVKKYFELLSEEIARHGEGNAASAISEAFKDVAQTLDELPEGAPVSYIHLKNAKIFAPGQEGMPSNGMLWRCRLDSIDGWTIGNLR